MASCYTNFLSQNLLLSRVLLLTKASKSVFERIFASENVQSQRSPQMLHILSQVLTRLIPTPTKARLMPNHHLVDRPARCLCNLLLHTSRLPAIILLHNNHSIIIPTPHSLYRHLFSNTTLLPLPQGAYQPVDRYSHCPPKHSLAGVNRIQVDQLGICEVGVVAGAGPQPVLMSGRVNEVEVVLVMEV